MMTMMMMMMMMMMMQACASRALASLCQQNSSRSLFLKTANSMT
jgi:hypothetical protein